MSAVELTLTWLFKLWQRLKLILAFLEFITPTGTCLDSSPAAKNTKTRRIKANSNQANEHTHTDRHNTRHMHWWRAFTSQMTSVHDNNWATATDWVSSYILVSWVKISELEWRMLPLTAVHVRVRTWRCACEQWASTNIATAYTYSLVSATITTVSSKKICGGMTAMIYGYSYVISDCHDEQIGVINSTPFISSYLLL